MAIETIKVPDIGGAENVDVIEISVAVGDTINAEDSVIVLESDKASMDIPSPVTGKIVKLLIKEGDQVSEGAPILEIETDSSAEESSSADEAPAAPAQKTASAPAKEPAGSASEINVTVPDIGGSEDVDVIEVCVKVGQEVNEGDSLIVLESDKASMEVPAPHSGKVVSIALKEGDKVSEGSALLVLSSSAGSAKAANNESPPAASAAPAAAPANTGGQTIDLKVPDIGGAEGVEVIEVCVKEGDEVAEGDSIIVLESDKASMEIPAEASGKILSLSIKVGDKVSQGHSIGKLKGEGGGEVEAPAPAPAAPKAQAPAQPAPQPAAAAEPAPASGDVYAGPAVRKLARQMGVDLAEVKSSGPRSHH